MPDHIITTRSGRAAHISSAGILPVDDRSGQTAPTTALDEAAFDLALDYITRITRAQPHDHAAEATEEVLGIR